MKRLLIGLSLSVLWLLTISAMPQKLPQAWEYKVEEKCFDEKLINLMGATGWELAGFSETDRGAWHCIFKRPK